MRSLLAAFDRRTTPMTLAIDSPAAHRPMPGLVVVEYTLTAEKAARATLEVRVGDAGQPALTKALDLPAGSTSGWFAVHTHLLANGSAKVAARLVENGKTAAEAAVTIQVRNEGDTARAVAESLGRRKVPLVIDQADSQLYDYADETLAGWFDRGPEAVEAHLAKLAADGRATPEEIEALRGFTQNGFLVLENVVDPDHLKRLNAALDDAVANKVEGYEWGESQRLHNLHHQYPAIKELWLHPRVMRMLSLIFDEPARACQSLTYVFGSEQQYHQDTVHLTPFPAGRMCGVWTALEDVQPDSGELVVFPGSHKAPRVYMNSAGIPKVTDDWTEFGEKFVPHWTAILERGQYKREVYQPKAGTILIWHENLMHAGQPRKDRDKSRRSIVGHYFAQGCVVYYDSSGMPGSVHLEDAAA